MIFLRFQYGLTFWHWLVGLLSWSMASHHLTFSIEESMILFCFFNFTKKKIGALIWSIWSQYISTTNFVASRLLHTRAKAETT